MLLSFPENEQRPPNLKGPIVIFVIFPLFFSSSSLPASQLIRILRLKDPDRSQNNAQRTQEEDE